MFLKTLPLHFRYISWYMCLSIFLASRYLCKFGEVSVSWSGFQRSERYWMHRTSLHIRVLQHVVIDWSDGFFGMTYFLSRRSTRWRRSPGHLEWAGAPRGYPCAYHSRYDAVGNRLSPLKVRARRMNLQMIVRRARTTVSLRRRM